MDQNTLIIVGVIFAIGLPPILNLRIFVRSTEFADAREKALLYINEHFVRKDDLEARMAGVQKSLDEIRDTQKEIFRVLNERRA